jgi:hypothetical protein
MIRTVRNALVAASLVAVMLGAGSPALAVGGERAAAQASAQPRAAAVGHEPSAPADRSPAGSEKSRVTSPGGTDGVALDLGYVEEPESPIPPVLTSMTTRDTRAIGVASVLLVGGMLLLAGGAALMIVTLARVSRRERHIERTLVRRDSDHHT